MKIAELDIIQADAGWRIFLFLKIVSADEPLLTWGVDVNEKAVRARAPA